MRRILLVLAVVMAMTAMTVGVVNAQVNGGINPLSQGTP